MSRMTEEEVALDKLEQLGKLPTGLLEKTYLAKIASSMQAYVDDAPMESDRFLEGLDITMEAAVELFNDFLLFMNEGDEVPVKVKDPTESRTEGGG